jgi:hypothetical protein
LQLTWLEDEPGSIADAVGFLEVRNFVVNVTTQIATAKQLVVGNACDAFLTDLDISGDDRDGVDLILELEGTRKVRMPIIPVTQYLAEFREELRDTCAAQPIEKASLGNDAGRQHLADCILGMAGGGRIRVLERAVGYVLDDVGDSVIARVELPDGATEKMMFRKRHFFEVGIGRPSTLFEITTVERLRGGVYHVETLLRWLPGPPREP